MSADLKEVLAHELGAIVYSAARIGFKFEVARQHSEWTSIVEAAGVSEVFAQLTVECFRESRALMMAGATRAEATEKLVAKGWAGRLAPHFLMFAGEAP